MAIDHRELAVFLNVARLGSVGAAAAAMALTQPALSRTLRRLEQQLGVSLFIRHSTGMELTTYGRSLLPHAESLANGLRRAVDEIDQLKGASKGVVRIGILPSLAPDHLPIVLPNVLQKLPGVQLQILEGPNHQLIFSLLRGEIDFAIATVSPDFAEDNIRVTSLVQYEMCIVARDDHPLLSKKKIAPADLCLYSWALQEKGGTIWRDFLATFNHLGLEAPTVVVTANSIQTLKTLIMCSDLVTVLPRISIQAEEKNGILRSLPLREAIWHRQLAIFRRTTGPVLPATNFVIAEFRKALASTLPLPKLGHSPDLDTSAADAQSQRGKRIRKT
ncbi:MULTISPECIES: LysR family transcriptional regulator [unclassified Beijerinckia]|uniref:LysR family transcriptional regulator n=1 Tax=unclassified Beijerinckia TaxID=2638183 RepID=UPI00089711C8|nr:MULTISPECIES: LysR family transcriptional regulator [unclassified Beijerinckia]MDH7799224.1 DNA-binding transcriptional LysR family regulator [Beijerinckia sp. GAS462]SED91468.1 DNA-binding transcriptional regulator, LysR family [Beijerinckia sp. 28-YEA-48]